MAEAQTGGALVPQLPSKKRAKNTHLKLHSQAIFL
jgi:hypothetical protein